MTPERDSKLRLRRFMLGASGVALVVCSCLGLPTAEGAPVPLQNATASFSQTFSSPAVFPIGRAIDGSFAASNGWAIARSGAAGSTLAEMAVFETVTDLGSSVLAFTLTQTSVASHTLGRFQLSVTTDLRTNFANSLDSGGQIGSSWTVLDPLTYTSSAVGDTFTELGDKSLRLSPAASPANAVYTITANAQINGITGFRLDVLADSSFPDSGPGRAVNGNFVLTEFQVDATPLAIPEPGAIVLAALGAAGFAPLARRRRRRV